MTYNILYLHNKSEISGGERSLLGLWENLDHQIFKPFLLVPSEGELTRQARQLGVEVFLLSIPQLRPWNLGALVSAFVFLRKFLSNYKIHLIHSHTPRNNILASLVGRSAQIPIIWHERNIIQKREFDITKTFLYLPSRIICNSKAVANRFDSSVEKIKVILNGVDLKKFLPTVPDNDLIKKYNLEQKQVVGIVTNLTVRRKVEYFIAAAKEIRVQEPNTVFLIVGGEFEQESRGRQGELEDYADRLGLRECLFFIGKQEDVRPWIALFDVCCHVTSQDACSRSVLEAMAMAKAIVAMSDGGNPELIRNNESGILVESTDQNSFVQAVVSLLRDKEKRKILGVSARLRTQQYFDIQRNTQETGELYLQCLKDK